MKTIIALLCLVAGACQADTVRLTVRNFTGVEIRFQNALSNDWRYVFSPGEWQVDVPQDSYEVKRSDSDTAVVVDFATDPDSGYVVQVNSGGASVCMVDVSPVGSPLGWAYSGMGLAAMICGVAWSKRNAEKIFKVSMEG